MVNDQPHGEGKLTMTSGLVLEGTWYKGRFQQKELTDYDNLPEGFELTGKEVDGHKVVKGK